MEITVEGEEPESQWRVLAVKILVSSFAGNPDIHTLNGQLYHLRQLVQRRIAIFPSENAFNEIYQILRILVLKKSFELHQRGIVVVRTTFIIYFLFPLNQTNQIPSASRCNCNLFILKR